MIDEDDIPGYLYDLCKDWIEKNEIRCAEDLYQVDVTAEIRDEFIADICDLVGYYKG